MALPATHTPRRPRPTRELEPRRFASKRPLARAELLGAKLSWPVPSRLERALEPSGARMAGALDALELRTVGELLEHLPSDSRQASTVAALEAGEQATVAVRVRAIKSRPVRRRGMRPLVQATVADASGSMRATFFNQPWLVQRYQPGTALLLHGKADGRGGFRVSHHAPADAHEGELAAAGEDRAVAHYPASEGISSTQLLTLVRSVRGSLQDVPEALPGRMRARERLADRATALAAMHFPRASADVSAGRERLAFEELLLGQLVFLRRRAKRRERAGALALTEAPSLSERWLAHALPFALTGDQRAAIAQIDADLREPLAMQRLLMGEVGSGKTVVALYAMLRAVEHGAQAALMAPTETLAEQHFQTVQRLLGGEPVAAALLTGSTPAARRRDVLGKLASGELSLIVGTHALIEPDVAFRSLAVAVIDEQHRFGVRQRAALDAKGTPHTLHMTATPIPRTLALAGYGDLDTSALRELPGGRRGIDTRLVAGARQRAGAYELVREELRAGRQAYIVCPLIEQEEELAEGAGAVRAAKEELASLRAGELRGFELVLLHGGMRPREKQAAMARFVSGEADVLVATTVIEVGIDVPNASVMLVENAERFGISQLHQLRGRVGRGEHASACLLVGPPGAPRLRALAEHSDGFRLAEIDLALRNEGELIGTRQSGYRQFQIARLPEDAPLLERARSCAEAIVAADAHLRAPEHALLELTLRARFGAEALEPIPA
ncbi:MAG TPA: ATP-dependent DNA helicase RecG [Solirubrobacteraceae bacterium]|jgi:ATP-dependent DNA helicase RecG|nr:ATP-dependent DNA helicase RecG [Solirubrobacteraceae bacterium]